MRPSERAPDALRAVTLETAVNRYAEGSCLVSFGHTKVLVTASLEEGVPPFLRGRGQGWVTAEYGMLPRATHTRGRREAAQGKQSGRTQEIQRLVGRSLRAVVDLKALGERQITLDCDVIQADGGTRTAAVTGGWVALKLAVRHLMERRGRCQLRPHRGRRYRRNPGHRRKARLFAGRVRGPVRLGAGGRRDPGGAPGGGGRGLGERASLAADPPAGNRHGATAPRVQTAKGANLIVAGQNRRC